jgi:hypothetical protein
MIIVLVIAALALALAGFIARRRFDIYLREYRADRALAFYAPTYVMAHVGHRRFIHATLFFHSEISYPSRLFAWEIRICQRVAEWQGRRYLKAWRARRTA